VAAVLSSFGLFDRNPTPPAFTMPAAARANQRGAWADENAMFWKCVSMSMRVHF
jgi:hypothetical protein